MRDEALDGSIQTPLFFFSARRRILSGKSAFKRRLQLLNAYRSVRDCLIRKHRKGQRTLRTVPARHPDFFSPFRIFIARIAPVAMDNMTRIRRTNGATAFELRMSKLHPGIESKTGPGNATLKKNYFPPPWGRSNRRFAFFPLKHGSPNVLCD